MMSPAMVGYDLHTHSTCSDGATSTVDNVRRAARAGLVGIAVTDHDTCAGAAAAADEAAEVGVEVIRGTEFSAEHDGVSVHVLGYWIDPGAPELANELVRLRHARSDRARRIVERLVELGIDVRLDRVAALAGDAPVGRPHIARAVVELGVAADEREVFDRYLADGGPAHVPKHAVDPVRAVRLLTGAGGVAVLAHPGLFGRRGDGRGVPAAVIAEMTAAGLVGIETDHPDHTPYQRERFRALASELGLLVTGGSDHHGHGREDRLGCVTTPVSVVEELRAYRAG